MRSSPILGKQSAIRTFGRRRPVMSVLPVIRPECEGDLASWLREAESTRAAHPTSCAIFVEILLPTDAHLSRDQKPPRTSKENPGQTLASMPTNQRTSTPVYPKGRPETLEA